MESQFSPWMALALRRASCCFSAVIGVVGDATVIGVGGVGNVVVVVGVGVVEFVVASVVATVVSREGEIDSVGVDCGGAWVAVERPFEMNVGAGN